MLRRKVGDSNVGICTVCYCYVFVSGPVPDGNSGRPVEERIASCTAIDSVS